MIGRLDESGIDKLIQEKNLARVGCTDGKRLYVVPVNYIADGNSIYLHSLEGAKIEMMRAHPEVCLQIDEIHTYTHWKSVMLWGHFEELVDERDRYHAMSLFVSKEMRMKVREQEALPEVHPERIHPRSPGNIRPVFYRIVIYERSGRYEEGAI